MDASTGAAGAEAGGGAAIAEAIKASGAIVRLEPADFQAILAKIDRPLIVVAKGGLVKPHYEYLTPYKGLVFFAKSSTPLLFGSNTEVVKAQKIWVPD